MKRENTSMQQEIAWTTIVTDGAVTVEKTVGMGDDGDLVVITFDFETRDEESVSVRLADRVPEEITRDQIGFHPAYQKECWELKNERQVVYEDTLTADSPVTTLYAVDILESVELSSFNTEPELTITGTNDDSDVSDPSSTAGEGDTGDGDATEALEAPADVELQLNEDALAELGESSTDQEQTAPNESEIKGDAPIDAEAEPTSDIELELPTDIELDAPDDVELETLSESEQDEPEPSDSEGSKGETENEAMVELDVNSVDIEELDSTTNSPDDFVRGGDVDVPGDRETGARSVDREAGAPSDENGALDAPVQYEPGQLLEVFLEEVADANEDQLESLREKLAADSTVSNSTAVRLNHVQRKLDDIEAYSDALEAFIDEHGTNDVLGEIQDDLDSLSEKLSNVEKQYETFDERISKLVGEFEPSIAEIEAQQEKLYEAVESLNETMNSGIERHDEELQGIAERSESLSDQIESVADQRRVDRERIESLQTELETMAELASENRAWLNAVGDGFASARDVLETADSPADRSTDDS